MFLFDTRVFSIYLAGSFCWIELESTIGKRTSALQFFNKHRWYRIVNYFTYKEG